MPTWGDLFERADDHEVTVGAIRERIERRRRRRAERTDAGDRADPDRGTGDASATDETDDGAGSDG